MLHMYCCVQVIIKSSLHISYRQNIWMQKSGPIARVICYTKPSWSYDRDCDDSWLLLSLLLCLVIRPIYHRMQNVILLQYMYVYMSQIANKVPGSTRVLCFISEIDHRDKQCILCRKTDRYMSQYRNWGNLEEELL